MGRPERVKDARGQYRVGSSLLLLFSAPFIVWQMGVLYYSGTTMSLFGRTPIPLTDSDTTLVICAGYLVSILMICLFPRRTVWMERVALPVALGATLMMLFPLSSKAITLLFCLSAFCCVFSIGTMASIAAQHFTVETTWRDAVICMTFGGPLVAIMQNDIFEISFTTFTLLSCLLIAAQTLFYYLIPADIETPYVGKDNPVKLPKVLFGGVWLISCFATLLLCFASSFAESQTGGVSTIYLSGSVMAAIMYLARKKGARAGRVFGGYLVVSVFGFVLASLSLYIPALALVACVLMGFVVVLANLWIYFAALSFSVYPTRYVGVIGAAMGLGLVLLHSGLQEALRASIPLLYGLYAAISMAMLLVYYLVEPHLAGIWRQDESPLPAGGAESVGSPVGTAVGPHPFDALSEQERILAGLILDGHTETSCARAMNITLNTQKSYRKNLYTKLGIHSKLELFTLVERRIDEKPSD